MNMTELRQQHLNRGTETDHLTDDQVIALGDPIVGNYRPVELTEEQLDAIMQEQADNTSWDYHTYTGA
jgi:hypothetical protein